MGCDIHMVAEARNNAGEWEIVPGPIIDCWACKLYDDKPCYWCCEPSSPRYVGQRGKYRDEWYSARNYAVFTVLADVRSRDDITPISEPRGWPGDLSAAARAWFEVDGGEHSESWLTLDEVLAYPWPDEVWCSAFVPRMRELAAITAGRPTRLVFDFDS